jgi:predicted nucleic acid-binding protein
MDWPGFRSLGPLVNQSGRGPERHTISVYDAAYAVVADENGQRLVSCEERDLVSKGLAALPGRAQPK